jgi:hypothetical protein
VDFKHEHFDQYATHSLVSEEEFFDALKSFEVANIVDDIIDTLHPDNVYSTYVAHLSKVTPAQTNFEFLCPLFGWTPADTIKRTIEVTTQYARCRVSDTIKKHCHSRFPACNVKRHNEPVATNTVISDTPAVDSVVTCAQLFVGRELLVADVYGLNTDKEFVNTLEDKSTNEEPWANISVMALKCRRVTALNKFFTHYVSVLGTANCSMRIRTLLRTGMLLSRLPLIKFEFVRCPC